MSAPTLDSIFPDHEARLLERVSGHARAVRESNLGEALERGLPKMEALARALEAFPPLHRPESLAGRARDASSLVERLLEAGTHALEWALPTKAVVSRAFGIAKVHFWSSLLIAMQDDDDEESGPLRAEIQEAWEEAIYTRLAEELYGSFVTSRSAPIELRRRAARSAVELWDGRIPFSTSEFCPLLRSAWVARTRAVRRFGTMMGTAELVDLLFKDCPREFIDVFLGSEDDLEMLQAFDEFLFDLPFEHLDEVRQRMAAEGRQSVGLEEVALYLGEDPERLRPRLGDPRATYGSFRRRRIRAQYRTHMRATGPKRTAESYVLEALLMQ